MGSSLDSNPLRRLQRNFNQNLSLKFNHQTNATLSIGLTCYDFVLMSASTTLVLKWVQNPSKNQSHIRSQPVVWSKPDSKFDRQDYSKPRYRSMNQ